MGFTENFNYCLEQRGYSAYRFAKIIGANIQSVVNWKTGATRPHYPKKVQIADHFGITLAELDGDDLPVLPPQGAKKAPATEGEDYTELQKAGIQFVLSLPPEKLERFIKMGRAAFEEEQ